MSYSRSFRILLAALTFWLLSIPGAQTALARKPAERTNLGAGPHPTLEQIVEKLTQRAEKLGCNSNECALLVTNFATNSGSTSKLGMKLADQFASLFAKTLPKGKVVDRSLLQQLVVRDRVPSKVLIEVGVARCLGKETGATMVLNGGFDLTGSVPKAMFVFLDVKHLKNFGVFTTEIAPFVFSQEELQPSEPFGPPEVPKTTKNGAAVYRAGVAEVGSPSCTYMPNPPYSEAARIVRISGVILIDAIVTPEGTVESP